MCFDDNDICSDCVVAGGTLTSVCSCDVCTNEYSPGDIQPKHPPHLQHQTSHSPASQEEGVEDLHGHHQHGLVETPCDNEKCIMCTPVPLNNKVSGRTADNNNYQEENNEVQPNQQLPPPLPKKTVAPYQVNRTITMTTPDLRKIVLNLLTVNQPKFPRMCFYDVK